MYDLQYGYVQNHSLNHRIALQLLTAYKELTAQRIVGNLIV